MRTFGWFYTRTNARVFFLLPAVAVGVDVDGRYFAEIAWGCWSLGFGDGGAE